MERSLINSSDDGCMRERSRTSNVTKHVTDGVTNLVR